MKPEPRVLHKLARSWCIQGIGWYALTEVVGRVLLESVFVVVLWRLGFDLVRIGLGWIAFHSFVWFLFYGGFMRIWVVLGFEEDVPRLREYQESVTHKVSRMPFARIVFLRGSAARGELRTTSDIDICVVPQPSLRAKFRGMLFWWALRAESVLRRKPLEARWIDAERYIPYHVIEETPRFVKLPDRSATFQERLAAHGVLVAVSGIDGSGKTTVAREVVTDLQRRGFDVSYFYGHRQPWYLPRGKAGLSLAILFESLWKRIGRRMDDWDRSPGARTIYQILTILDYLYVRWNLLRRLRPNAIIVCDRYVADVVAYMRSWGGLLVTLEGLFLGLNREPDVAVLLEIGPEQALERKREWDLTRLRRFVKDYTELRTLLRLAPIDALAPPKRVKDQIIETIENTLGRVEPI